MYIRQEEKQCKDHYKKPLVLCLRSVCCFRLFLTADFYVEGHFFHQKVLRVIKYLFIGLDGSSTKPIVYYTSFFFVSQIKKADNCKKNKTFFIIYIRVGKIFIERENFTCFSLY